MHHRTIQYSWQPRSSGRPVTQVCLRTYADVCCRMQVCPLTYALTYAYICLRISKVRRRALGDFSTSCSEHSGVSIRQHTSAYVSKHTCYRVFRLFYQYKRLFGCVCVCVCVRTREREREREIVWRQWSIGKKNSSKTKGIACDDWRQACLSWWWFSLCIWVPY